MSNLHNKSDNSRLKAFMDLPPTMSKASSLSSCLLTSDSIEDLYFDITSFDDSFIAQSAREQNYQLRCESDVKFFDTSSDITIDNDYGIARNSRVVDFNEIDVHSQALECNNVHNNSNSNNNHSHSKTKKSRHYVSYKSLLSMIKILKKFSIRDSNNSNSSNHNDNNIKTSILRRPREYKYVKGLSGLTIRVELPSSKTSSMADTANISKIFYHRSYV
jgi:hypothetical protein